jgi:hypothetical protein
VAVPLTQVPVTVGAESGATRAPFSEARVSKMARAVLPKGISIWAMVLPSGEQLPSE